MDNKQTIYWNNITTCFFPTDLLQWSLSSG